MRLLFCSQCKSVEEVPDNAPASKTDPLMEDILERHYRKDFQGHAGERRDLAPFRTAVVTDQEWNATDPQTGEFLHRSKILEQARLSNKEAGFDVWAYEAMNTYQEDAMRCFARHHRPKQGCIDYFSEEKRLGRPTKEGQLAIREFYDLGKQEPHLCQFCPVQSYVDMERRWRRGEYKR